MPLMGDSLLVLSHLSSRDVIDAHRDACETLTEDELVIQQSAMKECDEKSKLKRHK